MTGSDHWSGQAMDFKVSDATPEERAAQSAMYAAMAERMHGELPAVKVLSGAHSYRLDLRPEPTRRVLWGGRSLLDALMGRPVEQVGGEWDLELTRRDRERAAFGQRLRQLRSRAHGHHVHIAVSAAGREVDALWPEQDHEAARTRREGGGR